MKYDVVVIGAGVAGLTSALKLSSAGKKVLVIEKGPIPGGFGTSFKRKGFVFESSLHCVDSLDKDGEIRVFLDDMGVSEKVSFLELNEFARMIYPDCDFVADFNADNFINLLKEKFPQESENIGKLFSSINRFYEEFDRFYNSKLPEWVNFILSPFLYRSIIKTSILTAESFIARYIRNKDLQAIITNIWQFVGLPASRLSAFYFLIILRGYHCQRTCFVKGGFQRLFDAMTEKIKENGSDVKFNTRAVKIITQKNKVKSVVTDSGEEFNAGAIISNANAISTLGVMLDNQILRDSYKKEFMPLEKSASAVQVYLGLDIPAKELGMDRHILFINPVYNHDETFGHALRGEYDKSNLILTDHVQVDPSLAPEGKGSLLLITYAAYSDWVNLDKEQYRQKKAKVANILIRRAQQYLPGLERHIEVMEVATPLTFERYSDSPEGAIYGFAQTPQQAVINRLSPETKIRGLFLAGAWTQPGAGVHACFISGFNAAEIALKVLRKS